MCFWKRSQSVDCHDFYSGTVLISCNQLLDLHSSAFPLWWGGCPVFQREMQNLPVWIVVSTKVFLTSSSSPERVLQTKAICVNVHRKRMKWATSAIKTNLLFIFEWLFGHALIAIIISSSSGEPACTLTALHLHLTWVIVTFNEVVLRVMIHLLLHKVGSGGRPKQGSLSDPH